MLRLGCAPPPFVAVLGVVVFAGCEPPSAEVPAGNSTAARPSVWESPVSATPSTNVPNIAEMARPVTRADGRTDYRSAQGKFQVTFPPGNIAVRTEQTGSMNGQLTWHIANVQRPNEPGNFYVSYADWAAPSVEPDEYCRMVAEIATESIATSSEGMVISNGERAVGNRKGRQCIVMTKSDGKELWHHVLYVATTEHLYQVTYTANGESSAETEVEQFFSSFLLLE